MHDASATMAPAPQHMQALQRANEVRLARAELKRRVSEGAITAGEVILTCPWEAASMIHEPIEALRRVAVPNAVGCKWARRRSASRPEAPPE